MPRDIPSATEFRVRTPAEMEEVLYGVVETYADTPLFDGTPDDIVLAVEVDTAIIARREAIA